MRWAVGLSTLGRQGGMSGEKTEQATPKRRDEARKKGQVAFSKDLSMFLVDGATFGVLVAFAPLGLQTFVDYMKAVVRAAPAPGVTPWASLLRGLEVFGSIVSVPLGTGVAVALLAGFAQTGGLFCTQVLVPDLKRLAPSFKRIFGIQTVVQLLKSVLVVVVLGWVLWSTRTTVLSGAMASAGESPEKLLALWAQLNQSVLLKFFLGFGILALADVLYQRHQHNKKLMMSHEDIKNEYKSSEGDPQHKSERKRAHQEIIEQGAIAEVRNADFVVVNPTHIAVAMKYDRRKDAAPSVISKGHNLIAQQIKDIARQAGVPIFRDVTLARSLAKVEDGDEIPEALYEGVAALVRALEDMNRPLEGGRVRTNPALSRATQRKRDGRDLKTDHEGVRSSPGPGTLRG